MSLAINYFRIPEPEPISIECHVRVQEIRAGGEYLDKFVKAASQGSLYSLLIGIMKGQKAFSPPSRLLNEKVPLRIGTGVPEMRSLSAELVARLKSAAMTGPLSRDTAKLQAYSPALKECLDSYLFPDNQEWVKTPSYAKQQAEKLPDVTDGTHLGKRFRNTRTPAGFGSKLCKTAGRKTAGCHPLTITNTGRTPSFYIPSGQIRKGNPLISGKSRLVKYDSLARSLLG